MLRGKPDGFELEEGAAGTAEQVPPCRCVSHHPSSLAPEVTPRAAVYVRKHWAVSQTLEQTSEGEMRCAGSYLGRMPGGIADARRAGGTWSLGNWTGDSSRIFSPPLSISAWHFSLFQITGKIALW